MRKFTLIFILTIVANLAFAQVRITGTVKDAKNVGIAGASISIKNSYDGGTTDSTGKFSFRTIEKGGQIVVVTSIGYNNYEQKIVVCRTNRKSVRYRFSQ